ncbi:MAG: hypothetical protein HOY69_01650, partial [Streptomyces sp.]|nr:hypothetical protein [Streptomyces sp.]
MSAAEAVSAQESAVSTADDRPGTSGGGGGGGTAGRLRGWARGSVPLRAGTGAAVLACVVFCVGGLLAGSYPLGSHTRNV